MSANFNCNCCQQLLHTNLELCDEGCILPVGGHLDPLVAELAKGLQLACRPAPGQQAVRLNINKLGSFRQQQQDETATLLPALTNWLALLLLALLLAPTAML